MRTVCVCIEARYRFHSNSSGRGRGLTYEGGDCYIRSDMDKLWFWTLDVSLTSSTCSCSPESVMDADVSDRRPSSPHLSAYFPHLRLRHRHVGFILQPKHLLPLKMISGGSWNTHLELNNPHDIIKKIHTEILTLVMTLFGESDHLIRLIKQSWLF